MSYSDDIQSAIVSLIEEEVDDKLDHQAIAEHIDKSEIAVEIDFSDLIEEQVTLWFDKNYGMIEQWAKNTAEHVAEGHLEAAVDEWMKGHGYTISLSWWDRLKRWFKKIYQASRRRRT